MVVDKKLLLTVLVGQYGVLLSSGVSGDGKNSSYNLAGGLSLGLLAWLTEIVILLMVNLQVKGFLCCCLFLLVLNPLMINGN